MVLGWLRRISDGLYADGAADLFTQLCLSCPRCVLQQGRAHLMKGLIPSHRYLWLHHRDPDKGPGLYVVLHRVRGVRAVWSANTGLMPVWVAMDLKM